MDIVAKVRSTVTRYGLLSAGDRVIIGVSGGPDSMALWCLLRLLSSNFDLELKVVYVDHGLRGQGAKAEAGFVRSVGEKWGTEVEVVRLAGAGEAIDPGSVEARVRSGRLRLLEKAASDWRADRIALGHHYDDHIETVLISLVRGTGLAGLGGIPPLRGMFVRPLIECSRPEIMEFLEGESVRYCRDASNLEPIHLRNRIRHGLLPYLEAGFNPSMRRVLGRVADICRVDDEALSELAEAARAELCGPAVGGEIVLDLKKWTRYNLSLKRRVIRSVIGSLDPGVGEVELSWVNGVVSLSEGDKPGGRVDLGRGLAAYREYDKVIIGPAEETRSPEPFRFIPPCRDRFDWGGGRLRIDFEVVNRPGERFPPQEGPEAWFDPGAVAGPITVRPWESGDTIRPFASSGVKKLSDLFTDYKVPRRRRRQVPVVADEAGIIWVVGYRLADRVRVVEGGEKVLRGRVVREDISGGT